jgi:hypothetical protein
MSPGASSLALAALACSGFLYGCGQAGTDQRWYEQGQAPQTEWEQTAARFADELLARDFTAAHGMLTSDLKRHMTPRDLERNTEQLVHEESRAMDEPWVLTSMTQWPAKGFGDLGWAYVQIGGDNNEAIAMVVTREDGGLRIREIEWGRP